MEETTMVKIVTVVLKSEEAAERLIAFLSGDVLEGQPIPLDHLGVDSVWMDGELQWKSPTSSLAGEAKHGQST